MSVDHRTILAQIGRGNLAAISGLRVRLRDTGVTLPVANGYSVEVDYDEGPDTYTVRRVYTRGQKRWVKGEHTGIYCDQLGETAYRAHLIHDPNPS